MEGPNVPTILLVDDEPLVRRTVERLLTRAGYTVRSAPSAEEALRIATTDPSIALVLSDVMMDDLHGPELVARIRQRVPSLPVLFMSGETREHLPSAGVGALESFVAKPFEPQALLAAVGRALSPQVTQSRGR